VHVLQLGSSIREIVNMVTIAVVDVQKKEEELGAKDPQKSIFKRIRKPSQTL
jgi:malate dehydrogenase (oxaloacetate-decarboxylating)(NADP+)